MRSIHLACDAGEAEPGPARAHEMALLGSVSMVNVACGGHAGDADSMREAVAAAAAAGCAIAAHPSYPDRAGFGRVRIGIDRASLGRSLVEQIGSLREACSVAGVPLAAVKPHGALYHACASEENAAGILAAAVAEACGPAGVPVTMLAGAATMGVYRDAGLGVLREGYADRAYESDGSLRARGLEGALITEPGQAAAQAVALARRGTVEVLCVHGDTPGAVAIALAVRRALESAGMRVGFGGQHG